MKIESMQKVDRYLGQLLCFLVSLLPRKPRTVPDEIQEVLIIKMFGLGTIILMTPMVRALRTHLKEARILFLTFEENRAVVEAYGQAHRIYTVRRTSLRVFVLDTLKTVRRLRRRRPTVIIDGEFFSRYTSLLSFAVNAKFRSGFFNRHIYRGSHLDFRAYFSPYLHVTRSFLELAAPLIASLPESLELDRPRVTPAAMRRVKNRVDGLGSDPAHRPVILVNPNTSSFSRNIDRSWPLENFVGFGRHCLAGGFRLLFIGGPDDAERARTASQQLGSSEVASVAGETTIEETFALMTHAFMLVTNDSGPLHMAVSARLPTVSFFGTESPMIYGPASGSHKVFWKGLPCSPCLSVFNFKRGQCEFNSRCLRNISVGEVVRWFEDAKEQLFADYERRLRAMQPVHETPKVHRPASPEVAEVKGPR